jgi:hypothetical protein
MLSDVLTITQTTTTKMTTTDDNSNNNNNNHSVIIQCQDGSQFVFPQQDCAMLPIIHATAEELAVYLWSRILEGLNASYLTERGIHTMEVIVAEALGQEAVFRLEVPTDEEIDDNAPVTPLDVAQFVRTGRVRPAQPCPSAFIEGNDDDIPTNLAQSTHFPPRQQESKSTASAAATTTTTTAASCCQACEQSFSGQLQRIAAALNQNKALINLETITAQDLQQFANVTDPI